MNNKINLKKWLIAGLIFICFSSKAAGTGNDINELVLYLSNHDIIMTQSTNNNNYYEGYDYNSKAVYKLLVNGEGKIDDFTVEIADTTYERLNLEKILGLKWFTSNYLEKNEDYFKDIKESVREVTHHHSSELDLGEWKVNLFVFPLHDGRLDISLHFIDDAAKGNKQTNKSTLLMLKDIYRELGCIQYKEVPKKSGKLSYKLPYYKLNANESIYYNSFINKNTMIYKTQFIFYKTGDAFDYKDIPQFKQIVMLVTDKKNYPFEKVNLQFDNLKKTLINKSSSHSARSSWDYEGVRTQMDIEHYTTRNQFRIKVTVHFVKINKKQDKHLAFYFG